MENDVDVRAAKATFLSVVGVSRRGTSLMRNILNGSSQLALADENNFLGHLVASEGVRRKMKRVGDLTDDANVYRLVDFLYSGAFRRRSLHKNWGHWRWLKRNVPPDAFARRILATDRSDRAVFQAALQCYAEAEGKPVIGEKTPAHFRYVDTLFDWFPGGKVVHMVRDPRAIFVSEVRRRSAQPPGKLPAPYRLAQRHPLLLKLFLLAVVTSAWRQSITGAYRNRRAFPGRYLVLRFEDLVGDPDTSVRRVCAFLGVDFEPSMLRQEVVSKGFSLGAGGFDAEAAGRWRAYIDPWANRWFVRIFGKYLADLGYERA